MWFVYGDCEQPPVEDVGGCNAPLSVEVWPGNIPINFACRKVKVRGAPGALYRDRIEALDYNSIHLYIGDQTITIGADSRGQALGAAHALRTVEDSRPSSEQLPGTPIDAAAGLDRCS